MGSLEENTLRITAYFEDKMTPLEEEIFMQDLSSDETLRKQYEDELLINGLLGNQKKESENNDLMFQPADEHISMIGTALEKNNDRKSTAKVIKMFDRYKLVASASIILILLSLLFIFIKRNNNREVATIDKTRLLKDSIAQHDSIIAKEQLQAHVDKIKKHNDSVGSHKSALQNEVAKNNLPENKNNTDSAQINRSKLSGEMLSENLYKRSYTPYLKNDNDPVEVRPFYNSYKNGDYARVLAATDADIQLAGSGDRDQLLKQYLTLYKGLSYLAENKSGKAIQYFDSVLQSSPQKSNQYYQAQWYRLLAYLKDNNIDIAMKAAKEISQSQSIYKSKSEQLLKQINDR
jgi:hypothetical protein